VHDERFQSAKDVAFALATTAEPVPLLRTALSPRERYAWIAAVVCLTGVVAMLLLGQRRAQSSRLNITLVTTGRTTISQLLAPAIRSVLVSSEPTWNVDIRSTVGGSVEAVRQLDRSE